MAPDGIHAWSQCGLPLCFFDIRPLVWWCMNWVSVIFENDYLYYPFITLSAIVFVWAISRYPATLRKDRVVDWWNMLIPDAKGKSQAVFQDVEELIRQTEPPKVSMRKRRVWPGIMRGLLGEKRPFLTVIDNTNSNLKAYRMYFNTKDYGTNLQVTWYLVHEPGLWRRSIALLTCIPFVGLVFFPIYAFTRLFAAGKSGILYMDVFDEQDLRAFATNAHHCVLGAVEKLMLDLGQDTSIIKRETQGFLGIS